MQNARRGIKARLETGQAALGIVLGMGTPVAAELLTVAGFDFLLIDGQHGAWDDRSCMEAFRAAALGPAVPMTRVRTNDYAAIGRMLDLGALGIIVPMVNSAAEARAAAYATRYPPRGGRSWGNGLAKFHGADYNQWIDDEVFLAVQIETIQAVEAAEEILAVDGVDACWVGPVDLASSMGVDVTTPEGKARHEQAILSVLDACRRTGKIPGLHINGSPADARRWADAGFRFLTLGVELTCMVAAAQAALRDAGRTTW
jgi:4-hydroxy-2-oxoheptanedioate aldolase